MNSTFGERLKRARILRGWSQNELDRRAGVSAGMTSRIESGHRGTKIGHKAATVQAYADALLVRVEWLRSESGPMERDEDPAPYRALAVQIVRADGRIGEPAIAFVLRLPADQAKSTLDWIDLIRAKDTELRLTANRKKS